MPRDYMTYEQRFASRIVNFADDAVTFRRKDYAHGDKHAR
jgi:hypothetical protein